MWTWQIEANDGSMKTLQLIQGDMCKLEDECDIVVCSAYVGNYSPLHGTLIGSLFYDRGLSVAELSAHPELDLRAMGGWLSSDTGRKFRRIACVEMLKIGRSFTKDCDVELSVNKGFSTLRYILEQAALSSIPMATVATSLLGTGSQHIELEYVLGGLIAQCRYLLKEISAIQTIKLYERYPNKAQRAADAINYAFSPKEHPNVFLSYSSKQMAEALVIYNFLKEKNISCWMAPYSIPTGSNYLDEIPSAISQMKTLLLLLTPESEKSPWVQKEVSAAIGANKTVLPYKLYDFPLGNRFTFLLDGEQIYPGDRLSQNDFEFLLTRLHELGC